VRILGTLPLDRFCQSDREIVRLAVERKLEVLGEAGRRVSAPFRNEHPEIPWKDVVGLRNVISHQYDKVDYAEIYRIVRDRLPDLIRALTPLIPAPPETDC